MKFLITVIIIGLFLAAIRSVFGSNDNQDSDQKRISNENDDELLEQTTVDGLLDDHRD